MFRITFFKLFLTFCFAYFKTQGQELVRYEASGFSGEHLIHKEEEALNASGLDYGATGSSSSCSHVRFHRTRFNYSSLEEASGGGGYVEFSLVPDDGQYLVLAELSVTHLRRSGTGPEKSILSYSLDDGETWSYQNSTQDVPVSACGDLTDYHAAFPLNNLIANNQVKFRFTAWDAESASGIFTFSEIIVKGTLRSETDEHLPAPRSQASSITFSEITHQSMQVSWTSGNGEGRIVVVNTENAFSEPVDGEDPAADPVYRGSGQQVVYNGGGDKVTIEGLEQYKHYWVRVYEYNNYGPYIKYRINQVAGNPAFMHTAHDPECSGPSCAERLYSANSGLQTSNPATNTQLWTSSEEGEGLPYFFGSPYVDFVVKNGHKVVHRSSDFDMKDLVVEEGGHFLTERESNIPIYVNIFGDIICRGTIGHEEQFDAISFGIEDGTHNIKGEGSFNCARIRKNNRRSGNGVSSLRIQADVKLWWSSSAALFNDRAALDSYFDVTVERGAKVFSAGDISIDGIAGGASGERGGRIAVHGALESNGTVFLSNNNDTQPTEIRVEENGIVRCHKLGCAPSGPAGASLTVENSGILELTSADNPFLDFSEINNVFDLLPGSIVSYASNENQYVNQALNYQTLQFSGEGEKFIQDSLRVKGDLVVTGASLHFSNYMTFVEGNLHTEGSCVFDGVLSFCGNKRQYVNGPVYGSDVVIDNIEGVVLTDSFLVSGVLTLKTGRLSTDGMLVVDLSSGAISGAGKGNMNGGVTLRKGIGRGHYFYFSAPLPGIMLQQVHENVGIGSGPAANFYYYDETIPDPDKEVGWTPVSDFSTELNSGQGYALYLQKPQELIFWGNYDHALEHAEAVLPNTPSGNPDADGWHLVGNPYPSAIDFESDAWTLDNIGKTIYIYTVPTEEDWYEEGDGYWNTYVRGGGSLNGGSRYIGSMQGFWIKVTAEGGNGRFRIPRQARIVHENPPVLRRGVSVPFLKLAAGKKEGGFRDETLIRFSDDATNGFDSELDSYKFLNSAGLTSIYSVVDDKKLSVNTLEYGNDTIRVPLTAFFPEDGEFVLQLDSYALLQDHFDVVLEDKQDGKRIDLLRDSIYTFTSKSDIVDNRFVLHFYNKHSTLSAEHISDRNLNVYAFEREIVVDSEGFNSSEMEVSIYDVSGVQRFYTKLPNNKEQKHIINPGLKEGIYLVKVLVGKHFYSNKVVLVGS
ncbi:T9SS type A sorting domain-containing protein [Cytophagaceae bacterium ABcell3]|nr:T9SS type A sorting domain-containing protein [Cytophagaceae bacterium ABcell3]